MVFFEKMSSFYNSGTVKKVRGLLNLGDGKNDRYALLVLMIIVIWGGFVRFDGIKTLGMGSPDTGAYWKEAKLWSDGSQEFIHGDFYRPVLYGAHAMALTIFGPTDYAIKIFNGVVDIGNILLVFIIASLLIGSLWPSILATLHYTFLFRIVYLVRVELPHTLSTHFVLWSFLLFVLAERFFQGKKPRIFLLLISGAAVGVAANTHADLSCLGPGYVVCLLISAWSRRRQNAWFWSFVGSAAIFTLGFFTPYLLGILVFGFDTVHGVISNELTKANSMPSAFGRDSSFFVIISNMFYQGIYYFFPLTLTPVLGRAVPIVQAMILGLPIVWLLLRRRREKDLPVCHAPAILVLSYMVIYTVVIWNFDKRRARVLMPLIPFILIYLTYAYWRLFELFLKRRVVAKFVITGFIIWLATIPLVWHVPNLFPAPKQCRCRWINDAVKAKVDKENKLLVAPYGMFPHPVLTLPIYLGNDVTFLSKCEIEEDSYEQRLDDLINSGEFDYLYVARLTNPLITFLFEGEQEVLSAYVKKRDLKVYESHDKWGVIYSLRARGIGAFPE